MNYPNHTVESFNTMLNNYSESFTVNADLEYLTLHKWLAGEQESGSPPAGQWRERLGTDGCRRRRHPQP